MVRSSATGLSPRATGAGGRGGWGAQGDELVQGTLATRLCLPAVPDQGTYSAVSPTSPRPLEGREQGQVALTAAQ